MISYGALAYGAGTYGESEEQNEEWKLLTQRDTRPIMKTTD
jgi:hypothetical protein